MAPVPSRLPLLQLERPPCLGAALDRAEFEEVIPEFFACSRDVELMELPLWVPFANLYRIERLPIRFEPA